MQILASPENPKSPNSKSGRAFRSAIVALRIFAAAAGGTAAIVSPNLDTPGRVSSALGAPMIDGPEVCLVDGSYAPSERNPNPLNLEGCIEVTRLSPKEGLMFEALRVDGLNAEDSTTSR